MKKLFLVAEIGINHNGNLSIAKQLIEEAKLSGFDAVKFQKRDINLVYKKEFLDSFRESPWGKTQRKQKEGLEFGRQQYDGIDKYCKKLKIHWFASAWDLNSLKFLDKYKLKYNKIASAMIVDLEFLKEVAKRKKYTFISTGMSTIKDINNAVRIFRKFNCQFELMHCVSTYPMENEDANLTTIKKLKEKYKCNVGYSGHEIGLAVSYAAFGMGISSLERHVTLNRAMYGSDQAASVEKNGMFQLVKNIRMMEKSIGKNKMGHIHPREKKISNKLREHIPTYKPIKEN
jgi:N-acetylneuraminate synthase